MDCAIRQIGIIRSCFAEKFGIPRQAGLIPEAPAVIEIHPPFDREEAFRGLESFSHIWVLFVFHAVPEKDWKPCVRPPRLGGNRKVGVFASRSGFRPNPIGLSAVKLEQVEQEKSGIRLHVKGGDFLDQTPVIDIKPYLPYCDRIEPAVGGFAASPPEPVMSVRFTDHARQVCLEKEKKGYPGLMSLIVQILEKDPRPAYLSDNSEKTDFGCRLYRLNIRWEVKQNTIRVISIEDC